MEFTKVSFSSFYCIIILSFIIINSVPSDVAKIECSGNYPVDLVECFA